MRLWLWELGLGYYLEEPLDPTDDSQVVYVDDSSAYIYER